MDKEWHLFLIDRKFAEFFWISACTSVIAVKKEIEMLV